MRNSPSYGSGAPHSRNFDTIWSPLVKTGAGASNRSYAFFSLFLFLLLGAFLSTRLLLDPSVRTFFYILLTIISSSLLFYSISSKRHPLCHFLRLRYFFAMSDIDINGLMVLNLFWRLICRLTNTFRQTSHRTFDTCLHGSFY